jgi:hypothetical protein
MLSPAEFNALVEEVRLSVFTLDAWKGTGHDDSDFTTMCRMLQEIELFLTLRHAIKYGDIGLMRRLVDPLIVVFYGASQSNYGHEMLFYRWNLSPVNTPVLQHAILASGLVNWQGRDTTHKAIDLGMEHLNGSCKIEMKCYKNSTHDVGVIFDRVCLSNTWLRKLRQKMEGSFGENMSGSHTTQSCELDMFTLARNILEGGFARRRGTTTASGVLRYLSDDIFRLGMDILETKVDSFNNLRGIRRDRVQAIDILESSITIGGFDERADGLIDPTEMIDSDKREDIFIID